MNRPGGRYYRFLSLLAGLLLSGGLAAQESQIWRKVAPENLVFIGMREGEIVLELNPDFAPVTSARFRDLVREDFYRGLSFYRVIEGFVAQAGTESDLPPSADQQLPPEFERSWDASLNWTPVQNGDLYATQTGFVDGVPAAREGGQIWLAHCPGAVAMARDTAPDSGSTDFYIVLGQAPRYLDRNLTVFARVIDGMEVAQRIQRGAAAENGIISNDLARSRIGRMRLFDQLSDEERREYYVVDTNSDAFRKALEQRRERRDAFFIQTPPAVLDVCQVPVASRAERAGISRELNPK